jgi:pre-rRNA-processing protein IPI3
MSSFDAALEATSFPTSLLDDGLQELFAFRNLPKTSDSAHEAETEDYMALDENHGQPRELSLEEQNTALKAELEALRRLQTASFEKLDRINSEKRALSEREQKRLRKLSTAGDVAMTNGSSNNVNPHEEDSSSSDG